MSSDLAPLLIGLAAAGLLVILIGIVPGTGRIVGRIRSRRRRRQHLRQVTTGDEWFYRPRVPSEEPEPPVPTPETDAGAEKQSGDRESSSATIEKVEPKADELLIAAERQRDSWRESWAGGAAEDARPQTSELLEEAALEAQRIVVAAGTEGARHETELEQVRAALEDQRKRLDSLAAAQEAERSAGELLAAAESRRESLLRESEMEAARKAVEITEDARRLARERLEEAELEAKRIVEEANRERLRLVNALAQERAAFEETRLTLARFLADALEEVKGAPAASQAPAQVRDLDEARHVRTYP